MVVDGGPSATGGGYRADAGRPYSVAGGQSAGGDTDRARSVSLLQPPRHVSAAVVYRADLRVVPVAAADQALRADRIRDLDRADRGDASRRPGGKRLAALDHPDRPQHPGFRIRKTRLRGAGGVVVRGIGAAAGNDGDLGGGRTAGEG